jgi:hypothetical protein
MNAPVPAWPRRDGHGGILEITNTDGTAFLSAPKTILRRPARSTLVARFSAAVGLGDSVRSL